jgi:hypothetical protein
MKRVNGLARSGRGLVILAAALLAAGGFSAGADLKLTVDTDGIEREMFFTSDKLCFRDVEGIMVFDATQGLLRWVDLEDQSVHEVTKSDLEQLASTSQSVSKQSLSQYEEMMAQARKQAAAALENAEMSEDERRMAEAYMKQAMGGADKPVERTFEPTGENHQVNGRSCKGYRIKKDQAIVGELCTATLAELELTAADFAVIGKLREFLASGFENSPLMAEALAEFRTFDPSSEGFLGFPVRQSSTAEGETEVTTLVSLDKGPIDPQVFEAGKGLKKKQGPFGDR